jgi:hypothetical protein
MKLGLLAMSGVRAHNPELTALGLTLPGFVERNRTIASLPSLGLLTLAGLTPDSIDVEYIDVPRVHPEPWLPGAFDAVAISSFSAQIKEAYALADRYRAQGTLVVLGGLHVTAVPGEARGHADAIVIGEGEPVWPQLAADLEAGTLNPAYDARLTPFSLADAPMPRFDLLSVDRDKPADGADPARLPVQLRVLRGVDPTGAGLQGEAGRKGHRRDPADQEQVGHPLHRVRR